MKLLTTNAYAIGKKVGSGEGNQLPPIEHEEKEDNEEKENDCSYRAAIATKDAGL